VPSRTAPLFLIVDQKCKSLAALACRAAATCSAPEQDLLAGRHRPAPHLL